MFCQSQQTGALDLEGPAVHLEIGILGNKDHIIKHRPRPRAQPTRPTILPVNA